MHATQLLGANIDVRTVAGRLGHASATLDHPHWTVVLSAPAPTQFGRVRELFRGPMENPGWAGGK